MAMTSFDELTDRVERLLLRHEELRRINALLEQQVLVLTQERDSLRARLLAARSRIDALIDKLPAGADDERAFDGPDKLGPSHSEPGAGTPTRAPGSRTRT